MSYLWYILLAVGSYLLGNINFARIISKINKKDLSKVGSGNPGTLNVWRACGSLWPGVFTFVLDMFKGLVPTLFAYLVYGHIGCVAEIAVYIAAFSVVLGHIFPIVYKFKGGKGIATSVGVFFVADWRVGLIGFVLLLVGLLVFRYASIATLGYVIGCSVADIILCDPANWVVYIFICAMLTIILYAHRGNIKRLFTGKENRTEFLAMIVGLFKKKKKATQVEAGDSAEQPNSKN